MNDFAFAEELDGIADLGIVDEAEQIIVGSAGFLFCSHVFVQIGDRVAFYADVFHVKGNT